MILRNTVIAVITMALAGIPSIAGAADVVAPGGQVPPYVAAPMAPAESPPPTATPPYYDYNNPPAAYERPVPYPFRPYTPPPRYANPDPFYCYWDRGEPAWDGHRWVRRRVRICE